jgi:hypothetical protein
VSPSGWSTCCTITAQSAPTTSALFVHATSSDCISTYRPYLPCVIMLCHHPATSVHLYNPYSATCPASVDFLHVGQKLQNIVTFAYDIHLSLFKRRRKYLVELFTMEPLSSESDMIIFSWLQRYSWIKPPHKKNFWSAKSLHTGFRLISLIYILSFSL